MHRYCSDQQREAKRSAVTKILYLLAIPLTAWVNEIIIPLGANRLDSIPIIGGAFSWLISHSVFTLSISYAGIFALLYCLMDRFLWRKILHPFFNMPDIRGVWVGTLTSSYNGQTTINMELDIQQRLNEIALLAYFYNPLKDQHSSSYSSMASLVPLSDGSIQLEYIYKNHSHAGEPAHDGFSKFTILLVSRSMKGFYITNRHDSDGTHFTTGEMVLTNCTKKEAKAKRAKRKKAGIYV